MQVKISLLYNQFLARTNVALTSRMPCNSPYIFNYPLEYLAHWLFFGKFLSRASNTMPPRVRSPRPFCPCLVMMWSQSRQMNYKTRGCDKHRLTSKRMRREICWWRRRRWRTTCSRRATPCLIKTLNTQNRIIINESTPLISWRTRMVPPRGRSWGPRSRTPLGRPPRRARASWAAGASSPGRCTWTCPGTARRRPVRKIIYKRRLCNANRFSLIKLLKCSDAKASLRARSSTRKIVLKRSKKKSLGGKRRFDFFKNFGAKAK